MMDKKLPLVVRLLRGFAMFWWDFLVGDTPELFLAVVLTIGVVALLSLRGHFNVASALLLSALAVAASRAARRK